MVASFDHVGDGHGRYGTHSYTRTFTVGADVRTHVYVQRHKTVVTRDGRVLRTMPSDAGSPQWPSWDGTMAVIDTARTVRMTSCSVHITCDKQNPNYYDVVLPLGRPDHLVRYVPALLDRRSASGAQLRLPRLRPPLLRQREVALPAVQAGRPRHDHGFTTRQGRGR